MKKEVNGIELLQLIYDKKKNNEKIYSNKKEQEFHWNGTNLINNNYNCYLTSYNDIDFINDTFIVNIDLTSDELFECLGYIMKEENENYIEYEKEYIIIMFNKIDKTYRKVYDSEVTIEEHIAIDKKMEELGWLQ